MTVAVDLERTYRRRLRWYPRAFRRGHEEEVLAVLVPIGDVVGRRITAATFDRERLVEGIRA